MRYACSVLLAVLFALGLAGAQGQAKDKGKHEGMKMGAAGGNDAIKSAISGMEKELREGNIKGDASAAEKYLADDYHSFSAATLQMADKKTVVDGLKGGRIKYSSIDVSGDDVQIYSPMLAVAHGEATVKGNVNGKAIDGKYHYGRTWTKRAGKWQAVWFQTTKVQ